MKISDLRICIYASVFILLLIPFTVALANSAPPPVTVWFVLQADSATISKISGAKVIGCPIETCSEDTAKYESGKTYGQFVHTDNLYYWQFSADAVEPSYWFRLILQFPNGARISQAINDIPLTYGSSANYRVIVNDTNLTLERIADFRPPGLSVNYLSFLITLVCESLVGATIWGLWKKAKAVEILKFATWILLANAICYPVLWSYFASIIPFHSKSQFIAGIILLLGGIVFSVFLLLAFNSTSRNMRIALFGAAILSIPTSGVICVMTGGLGYGWPTMIAEGVPIKTAILMLEICTVIWESILLYGLTKRQNSFVQMIIISLIMNLASFGVGLLLYNPFA